MPSGIELPTVAESIRDATAQAMREDKSVILFGLGVNDPGRVFGTTTGLVEEFGIQRVFETPTAESAMMGVAVGAALAGLRPVVTHQRADFFYLAMDQLVNSAAKWRFMFGGQFSVPLVVRLVVGRGWGQGPTHSQNLATWLSQIPGLKVVYPSNSINAGSLLLEAVQDDNPVVFIEDRWLHTRRPPEASGAQIAIGRPVLRRSGDDFTVVAYGLMVSEALMASEVLARLGVTIDVIDLGTLLPLELALVQKSLRKTGRLLVIEAAPTNMSFGIGLIGAVATGLSSTRSAPHMNILGLPPVPVPTSFGATAEFYPDSSKIVTHILGVLGVTRDEEKVEKAPHDVNSGEFAGPF